MPLTGVSCLPARARAHTQVTKVELLLNYEGAVQHPLAIGSIDNFLLELAVHPATLQVRAGQEGEGLEACRHCLAPAALPAGQDIIRCLAGDVDSK
jgi:hypothetical protein